MQSLFDDFPSVSKEEWLKKIEKDLKGKPFTDLQWQLEDNIQIDPLYHPDDQIPPVSIPWNGKHNNDWEIGEYIIDNDPVSGNSIALSALQGGAQALLFQLKKEVNQEGLAQLLNDIELDMVSTHFEQFYSDKDPAKLLKQIFQHIQDQKKDAGKIEGSIDFDPMLDWVDPPMDKMQECIIFCQEHMPKFKILQVNGREFHGGNEYSSRELGYILAKGNEYLSFLSEKGMSPELVNKHMQFAISISTSFFVEIAKLRAFRLLWGNILKAHGVDPNDMPPIEVHLARETQDEDMHTNMIRASTQAMSAIIGGADRLYVRPSNMGKKEVPTPFTLRIARNVQQLLKLESYLDRVLDPAAGSYYIEILTHKLAEEAWAKFQEIEKNNEFSL